MTDEGTERQSAPGIGTLTPPDWAATARPTLGPVAAVGAFRAVRLGALGSMAGAGLSGAVYLAGRNWARSAPPASLAALFQLLVDLRLGVPRLVSQTPEQVEIELAETLSAAGVRAVGEPLCHLEAGFLAGALGSLTGRRVRVREVACWGLGQTACRFVAQLE